MTRIESVEQAEATPDGVRAHDGWGEIVTRRGDGWVREIWVSSEELLADGPVEIAEDEDEA
ncbi:MULTISPECIES: hypothetical protein [Nocardia]|uniref:hypothetical protein n=1 Tax=Nocardia TaxID=1817 RepID=UPI000D69E4F5|nr:MULTISPECIES: hypothetical protein [Nocardia]